MGSQKAAWPDMQVSRVPYAVDSARGNCAAGSIVQKNPVPWKQNHVRPGRVNRETGNLQEACGEPEDEKPGEEGGSSLVLGAEECSRRKSPEADCG